MRRKIKKEDIVQAGLDLMFLNGYNATGIKDITDSIGIPKGSFYNHFSSKEEFGLAVLQFYCDRGVQNYKNALLDGPASPMKRLNKFFSGMIKSYSAEMDCKLGCVMGNFSLELADVNERFRVVLDREFLRCQEVIEACLQEAQSQGELDKEVDTSLTSGFILNSWHGALVRMKSTGTTKPLKDFKTFLFQSLLN